MTMKKLCPVDREALERAIEIVRTRKTPADRQQIERMLREDPWEEVGRFAAYSCQCDVLRLKLWQPPPVWVRDIEATLAAGDDGVYGYFQAAKLLRRLLAAGLSHFEPDPIAALEAAERKVAAAAGSVAPAV